MVLDRLEDGRQQGEGVRVHVEHGWVILKGTVGFRHQRIAIENLVRSIPGVRGLSNRMKIDPARVMTIARTAPVVRWKSTSPGVL
jgi:osmotically-inducible protein OsmY